MRRRLMKALLLRVGADTGEKGGGFRAPIFNDGSFKYIPIPEEEPSSERRTYGKLFSNYVPIELHERKLSDKPVGLLCWLSPI